MLEVNKSAAKCGFMFTKKGVCMTVKTSCFAIEVVFIFYETQVNQPKDVAQKVRLNFFKVPELIPQSIGLPLFV